MNLQRQTPIVIIQTRLLENDPEPVTRCTYLVTRRATDHGS